MKFACVKRYDDISSALSEKLTIRLSGNGYTYDDEARTITLKYPKPNESIVTTIRIKDYDENSIELDFEGDIRIFTKEN